MAEQKDNTELIDQLKEDFDDHLRKVFEKNKDYKFTDNLTLENFEEVRNRRNSKRSSFLYKDIQCYKWEISQLIVKLFIIQQEIVKTPAFLDRVPTQEEIDASPALSALQALKYEETDPTGFYNIIVIFRSFNSKGFSSS